MFDQDETVDRLQEDELKEIVCANCHQVAETMAATYCEDCGEVFCRQCADPRVHDCEARTLAIAD